MQRFTKYLYEWHQDRKMRNTGFVKGEMKGRDGRLQIQGRGFGNGEGAELEVYLFYRVDDGYEEVLQGHIPNKTPSLNYVLEFHDGDIGNARGVEDIAGLLLKDGEKRYAAVFDGDNLNVDDIHGMKEAVEEPVENQGEQKAEFAAQSAGSGRHCEKIQRRDLARLPRKDWRLANNNFLLHGFYNYHHLLWIEDGQELYIGVPGVCHAREIQAARAFGFTEFRRASETELEPQDDEWSRREDFGYFCRRIMRNE